MVRNNKTRVASVAAALAATVMAGCSTMDMFDDDQRLGAGNPVVVDRFTAQTPDVAVGNHSDYTTSIPQLGQATAGSGGIAIRDDNPGIYTVVRGDTLWDISARFLTDAWEWPKVWKANPGIKNPHLIYPGDQIALRYDADGIPSLVVSRNGQEISDNEVYSGIGGAEKLSPRVREESLEEAIPTIPGDAIRQFLAYPRVVSARQLAQAPYVIGNDEGRLTSAMGHEIYARGNIDPAQQGYAIFRKNKALRDPVSNELLGHEITHVASAKLRQIGDPATLVITNNKMETISGDRLMQPSSGFAQHTYIPRTPAIQGGEGRIVSLVDALSQSGRNQIVVLNLGDESGVRVGDVLAVERRGGMIKDRHSKRKHTKVAIPNTRTGVVMVFQTFDKVSYALVMESTRPINRNDIVTEI